MRRANYAVIITLVAGLGALLWWSLERFEEQDRRASQLYNTAMFHWANPDWDGQGDWRRAGDTFRQLLDEYPESQWAVQAAPLYAATLMNRKNDTAALAAAEYYAERYRGGESEGRLWFLQGQCLKRLDRPAAAGAALRICREQFPGTAAANDAIAVLAALPPVADTWLR